MSVSDKDPASPALQAFNTAQHEVDEAWKTFTEPTVLELQMRAIGLGVHAAVLSVTSLVESLEARDILSQSDPSEPLPYYYSADQVAEKLGVDKRTVNRWADRGHFEFLRLPGGSRRISRESLNNFISQHTKKTPV